MRSAILCVCILILLPVASMADWQSDYRGALSAYNFTSAFRIAQREADRGNPEAQNNLGLLYINGQGVAKDETEGLAWLMVAARNGAKTAVGNVDFVKGKLTRVQVDRASEIARTHRTLIRR